jgi:phenol hydroxylase P1 protein
MNIDIQAETLTPKRQTFSHVARRIGENKAATRYEEATYDIQATHNFHYRPLYAPEREIFDKGRTAIVMQDWYVFKDPRQFYYASYNINRAAMQQDFDSKFAFVEKTALLSTMSPAWAEKVAAYLVPMRHYEWGANMNCQMVADAGYGAQITSAASFCGMDRVGLSQTLSRIGLLMDATSGVLNRGRTAWLEAPAWQGLRHAMEDSFVLTDWFETFVAQFLCMDGILHPLVFQIFEAEGQNHGGMGITMLSEFPQGWYADNARWVDAVVNAAAAESAGNAALLSKWFAHWTGRAVDAVRLLAAQTLAEAGTAAAAGVEAALKDRARKLGLEVSP